MIGSTFPCRVVIRSGSKIEILGAGVLDGECVGWSALERERVTAFCKTPSDSIAGCLRGSREAHQLTLNTPRVSVRIGGPLQHGQLSVRPYVRAGS